MIDTLFICKANVQRSQVAEGLYNHYSKRSKAISCAGIEARKEKYNFKPEKTITNILLKDGVNIQEQKINYIADFSTDELSNIKKVIFLFDPNIKNDIDPECLIDGISPYKYFQNIKSTKIIIHKIKDPYKLGLDETIKIYYILFHSSLSIQ